MASATEVGNAFSYDTSGIESSNRFYAQLRAHKQQQEAENKRLKDNADLELIKDIGAHKPTLTSWDAIGDAKYSDLQSRMMADMKANPNDSGAQRWAKFFPEHSKVVSQANQALQTDATIKPFLESANKENPWIDQPKLRQLAYRKAFYDDDGKLRETPNALWQEGLNLQDEAVAEQVANMDALPTLAQKELKTLYQPTEQSYRGDGQKTLDYTAKIYPYSSFNPETGKISRAGEVLNLGESQFHILSPEKASLIPDNVVSRLEQKKIRKELEQNPDFESLAPPLRDLAVKSRYLEKYGYSEAESSKDDDTRIRNNRADRREQQMLAEQKRDNDRQDAEFAYRRAKDKKSEKVDPNTPTGVYNTIVQAVDRDKEGNTKNKEQEALYEKRFGIDYDPEVYAAVFPKLSKKTQDIMRGVYSDEKTNIEQKRSKAASAFKMANISAAAGGYLQDANTQRVYKLFSVKDNYDNDVHLVRQYFIEDANKNVVPDDGKDKKGKPTKSAFEIVKDSEKELINLGTQVKGTPEKQKEILYEQVMQP